MSVLPLSFIILAFAFAFFSPGCAPVIAAHAPIILFHDDVSGHGQGPTMVVIPAGTFYMGSREEESGREENEGPRHKVTFDKPFAIGQTEVTVAQFRQFILATGYATTADLKGGSFLRDPQTGNWGLQRVNWQYDQRGVLSREDNPVVHVSWHDASAYTRWLSEVTGKHYRLPSEAELEYVNRAGTQTVNWWGDQAPTEKVANLRGALDGSPEDPTFIPTRIEQQYLDPDGSRPDSFENYGDGYWGLAPVASYKPNSFGLYDTTGNVWEWGEDCWHVDYEFAPEDGTAWDDHDACLFRVARGASWYCQPIQVRAANRWWRYPHYRNMYIGFRIARDLDS